MEKQLDYTKINPRKLRRAQREVCYTIDVCQLERLSSWLFDDSGKLSVTCQFDFSSDDSIKMTMTLSGALTFLCQRCSKPFVYEWSSETIILLDEEDTEIDGRSDEYFERIQMSYDGTFNLIDAIVDEVILGMPKTHPTDCKHDRGFEF